MDKNMTLEKRIDAELYSYQGRMSVFVDDLQGHTVERGADEEFETASVIKAFLLAQMARGTLVSKAASVEMLAILRQQHYNTMLTKDFPQYYLDCEETGAPELLWVASKSGSMNACRNDGGIVHTPYGEYVIVLMNKDFHDIIEYNDHPAIVYGARVSRIILDQVLACEGKLWLD